MRYPGIQTTSARSDSLRSLVAAGKVKKLARDGHVQHTYTSRAAGTCLDGIVRVAKVSQVWPYE